VKLVLKDIEFIRRPYILYDSVIHSDGWKGYNGTVDFGYKKHFRVHHGKNEFARGNAHRIVLGLCQN
jgi:hypothetical protein